MGVLYVQGKTQNIWVHCHWWCSVLYFEVQIALPQGLECPESKLFCLELV